MDAEGYEYGVIGDWAGDDAGLPGQVMHGCHTCVLERRNEGGKGARDGERVNRGNASMGSDSQSIDVGRDMIFSVYSMSQLTICQNIFPRHSTLSPDYSILPLPYSGLVHSGFQIVFEAHLDLDLVSGC